MSRPPVAEPEAAGSSSDHEPAAPAKSAAAPRFRRRRRLLIAAPFFAILVWALASYTTWMLRPTSTSFFARSVEWVRTDVPFGNSLVDHVEQITANLHAPKKGGPQLKHLPAVGGGVQGASATSWPPPIQPVFQTALPGEGVWKGVGPKVRGRHPVLLTTFRTERAYPQIVAYVAWLDHTRTALAFYPGRYEPPHAAVRGPMMVPQSQRSRLLATFNSGFVYKDGSNGSTDNGLVNEPLKQGNATLVGYRNGRVDIVDWTGGPNAGPNVAWTRQSLAPIVMNGRVNPALNASPNSSQWGYTLGGVTRVWRTAVGVDARGNLIYVAAPDQTVITLAHILKHVGAVRAMEFDINPYWHSFNTYSHRHGLTPTQFGYNPNQPDTRYLVPDDRDFFAVYSRRSGPVTVPFS
ncbi:MAG: phosphodiester glycosidase family protein [Mycobacteriales bacterium]